MARQLALHTTGKFRNTSQSFYVDKEKTISEHKDGFLSPENSSNSAMSLFWLQIIIQAGNVKIDSFAELLSLTNYVEAVNERAKVSHRQR